MSNLKRILKIIVALIISFIAIIMVNHSTYAISTGETMSIDFQKLKSDEHLYCTDHAGQLKNGAKTYTVKGYITIKGFDGWLNGNEDDKITQSIYAKMAYILGAETDSYPLGYHSKGIRQRAVWSIWNDFVNYNQFYKEVADLGINHNLHPSNWGQTVSNVNHTGNELERKADDYANSLNTSTASITSNITQAIRTASGYIQCSANFNVDAISSIDIEYNVRDENGNPTDNSYNIVSGSNTDWFKLYAADRATPIDLSQIKSGDIFYIYCPYTNAQITKIKINIEKQSMPIYKANIYFLRSTGSTQRLVYVDAGSETGSDTDSCEIPVQDTNKVNLTIKKAGGAKDASGNVVETKSELEGVTFNLKLSGSQYVGIDSEGFVEYYDTPQTLTTDANGEIKIYGLRSGTYILTEISIGENEEYRSEIIKAEITTNNGTVTISNVTNLSLGLNTNFTDVNLYVVDDANTGSMKIIKKGPSLQDYTQLVNLPNTTVLLYRMPDTRFNGGKVGFVTQNGDSLPEYTSDWTRATQYTTDGNGEVQINRLYLGTYRIYEIKSSDDEFYNLEEQDRYRTDDISATNNWVYLGNIEVTGENTLDSPALAPQWGYFENQRSVGDLKLIKKDSIKSELSLAGAKFKLYSVTENAWVTFNGTKYEYNENSTADQAAEFTTGEDGTLLIRNLHFADYKIYETVAPTGYDITKQIGYGSDSRHPNWVLIKDPNDATRDLTITISKEQGRDAPYEVTIKNKKVIAALEGFVWKDLSNVKNTTTDEVYTEGSYDELLGGIQVELYDGNGQKIATTVTDNNDGTNKGHYKFTKKDSGEEIYYWDLANGYVKFIYNDKEYITVTPFVGTDVKVNSKAQEENVKLDDNQLTGRGEAVTYRTPNRWDTEAILENNKKIANKIYGSDTQNPPTSSDLKETPITGYYDERDFIVKYINLGLVDVVDPTYEISEELAYIKVKLNGYTYTYVYGEATDINSNYVPKVNVQNTKDSYNRYAIYPSDIAYSMKDSWNNAGKLQVYVVYKISVTNTTTLNIPKVYREEKLFLNSLTNLYDTNRYDLCNNENNVDSTDFALWSNSGNGTASYSVNDSNSVYKNGIIGGNTISSYIQFKVKEPALERILSGESITNGEDDKEASKAASRAYHEYLRLDNVWNEDQVALQTAVNRGYITAEEAEQNKFYTHKSIIKTGEDDALYLKMALGDERKITGTVYEDTKSAESGNENLGNGIIDDNEQNRAKDVKVELVDRSGNPVYRYPDKNTAGTQEGVTTDQNGYYEIPGVEPGYYYLKYTYGDGTQKMVDASGNEVDINLRDYKSTIVTSDATKNAMKKTAFENPNNEEIQRAINTLIEYYAGRITDDSYKSAQEMLEWYKSLGEVNYSVASDNINERNATNGYVYKEDGSIYNGEAKVDDSNGYILDASGNKMVIHSYTPMVGISIENDEQIYGSSSESRTENVHINSYDRLNLGIIKETPQDLKVEKKITNVKLTNQQGSTLVSSNPKDALSRYLSDLDGNTVGGSKYARLEMDPNALYGSSMEATYEVTLMNNSYEDYIEDEGSSNYGWYFKYGEKVDGAKLKETTVKEVIDELDPKYNYASLPEKVSETKVTNTGDIMTTENKITLTPMEEVTEVYSEESQVPHKHVTITGWDSMTTGESLTIDYLTTVLYGNQLDDSLYENSARITSLNVDNLATLTKEKAWGDDYHSNTTLIVMPSTGENRSNNYIIIAVVAILTLGIGIIFIKKKVLK